MQQIVLKSSVLLLILVTFPISHASIGESSSYTVQYIQHDPSSALVSSLNYSGSVITAIEERNMQFLHSEIIGDSILFYSTKECGNNFIDVGEECDGNNFNSVTCATLGYSGGSLSCNDDCTFNTNLCFFSGGGRGDRENDAEIQGFEEKKDVKEETIDQLNPFFCRDDSYCNIAEGERCILNECVKLFDIVIIEIQPQLVVGEEFEFQYFVKGVAVIEDDVHIDFWIEKDGTTFTSGSDVVYIGSYDEKIATSKLYVPKEIPTGIYRFYVQVTYRNYVVSAHRTLEILKNEATGEIIIKEYIYSQNSFQVYGIVLFSILFIFSLFVIQGRIFLKTLSTVKRKKKD